MDEKYAVDYSSILGEGAYGRVYRAAVASTGEAVALKVLPKRLTDRSSFFGSETPALLRIYDNGGHPNISGLRDMYEDDSRYCLLLDLAAGGELFDALCRHGAYSELDASRLVSEVLSALAFLHNVGVVHSDLKPENILLCSDRGAETLKIIDFGCAVVDDRGGGGEAAPRPRDVGTKAYWSPERFAEDAGPATEASDVWALGVIVYIMLVGVHPFDPDGTASDAEIHDRIRRHSSPPMGRAGHLSPSARDFLRGLMSRDPDERLTAITALRHPWVRGDTPTTKALEGSDERLRTYRDLREKLRTGIFAALVDGPGLAGDGAGPSNGESLTHLLKRAFDVFDASSKGFIDGDDLGRVVSRVTGTDLSEDERSEMIEAATAGSAGGRGLSLSDFTQLFSRLGHEHHNAGDCVYRPGDEGDAMYFINSGRVEILSDKDESRLAVLGHGGFFGEGSLLEDRNARVTAVRCLTPADLIRVPRGDFERYLSSSSSEVRRSLRLKYRARTLSQAKQLMRLQSDLVVRDLGEGETVYVEGDEGESMFLVDGGRMAVKHGGKVLHELGPGDSFGESSLLFKRPRSSTVVCAAPRCRLHEMMGEDFNRLIEADANAARAIRDMCRKRMLQKAAKSYLLSKNSGTTTASDLERAFRDADGEGRGTLALDEVRNLMLNMGKNAAIPEPEIQELLKSLDHDDDGRISIDEIVAEMSRSIH